MATSLDAGGGYFPWLNLGGSLFFPWWFLFFFPVFLGFYLVFLGVSFFLGFIWVKVISLAFLNK